MIDALSIIFSTLMCMFIVLRAVKLDRSLPWYGSPGSPAAPAPEPEPEPHPGPAGATAWMPDWDSPHDAA